MSGEKVFNEEAVVSGELGDSLPGDIRDLAASLLDRSEGLEKIAAAMKEQELAREVIEDLIRDYDEQVNAIRELAKGYETLTNSPMMSRWSSQLSEIRRKETYDTGYTGTDVAYRLDGSNPVYSHRTNVPLSVFCQEAGLDVKIYRGNNVIAFAKSYVDELVDNSIVRKPLELPSRSDLKTFVDERSGFTIAYPENQFEVYPSEFDSSRSSSRQSRLVEPLSYINIRPYSEYYDYRLNERGEPQRFAKAFTATIAEFFNPLDRSSSEIKLSSIRLKELNVDSIAREFNKFFVEELKSIGVQVNPAACPNFYDVYSKDKQGVYTLLKIYRAYLGITESSDIPNSNALGNNVSRDVLIEAAQKVKRNRLAIMAQMPFLSLLSELKGSGKKYFGRPGLSEWCKEFSELMKSPEFRNDFNKYRMTSVLQLEQKYLSVLSRSSRNTPEHREELSQKVKQISERIKSLSIPSESKSVISDLEARLTYHLTELGRERLAELAEKARQSREIQREKQTSYLDSGYGAVDVRSSVEIDEEFPLDEAVSANRSTLSLSEPQGGAKKGSSRSQVVSLSQPFDLEAFNKEMPPEIEGIQVESEPSKHAKSVGKSSRKPKKEADLDM